MFEVVIEMDGLEHVFGIYDDRNKANEIAMRLRETRNVDVSVYAVSL